jgi:RpiB/LacA/LacB family sugar-phosphate isomerase
MEIIGLASDHRGYELKTQLIGFLRGKGHMPLDVGTHSPDRCDAQDYAVAAALAIKEGKCKSAILICGSGQMMAITANRFPHIRAAVCTHTTAVRATRQHNDANVLAIGADFMGMDLIKDCIETFIKTEFLGGRYAERNEKLAKLDVKNF